MSITIKLCGKSIDFAGEIYGAMANVPPDSNMAGAIEFRQALSKYQPKADPTMTSAIWGYGAAKVIVEAFRRAEEKNDLTREGVIKAMESLKDLDTGVFPPIGYSSTSHAGPESCLIVKRQGNTFIPVSRKWVKAK